MHREQHIAGIDGVRALAVLAVMFFHLDSHLLPGGFSGVDVFFVISGYVVSLSVGRYLSQSTGQFYLTFLARRIRRIVPALLGCVLVTSILCLTLIPPGAWLSFTIGRTAVAACFGLSNFALIWLNDGYFSPRAEFNPFTHTWSLAVEEQFYLLFPLLFLPWLRPGARPLRSALLLACALASFGWAAFASARYPQVAFYLLPSRFWELAAGVALQHAHATGRLTAGRCRLWLNLGLGLVVLGFITADAKAFPFPWALLPAAGTLALLHGIRFTHPSETLVARSLAHPVMRWLGRLSYSLYLWHWPIYVLMRWTTGLEGPFLALSAFALTFGFAVGSYYLVEEPFRRGRSGGVVSPVVKGVLASAVAASFVHFGFQHQNDLSLSVASNERVWSPYYLATLGAPVKVHGRRTLFVIGDSHAAAYTLLAREVAQSLDADYEVHSRLGCPVATVIRTKESAECQRALDDRLQEVTVRTKPGDVVFFASLRLPRLSTQWEALPQEDVDSAYRTAMSRDNLSAGERDAERLIAPLIRRGVHVILDAPKPVFRAPPFRCLDWFNRTNPICAPGFEVSRAFMEEYRKPVVDALQHLRSKYAALTIWDPLPALCEPTTCRALRDGQPLFSDGDHLSALGNQVLVPSFRNLLSSLWSPVQHATAFPPRE